MVIPVKAALLEMFIINQMGLPSMVILSLVIWNIT